MAAHEKQLRKAGILLESTSAEGPPPPPPASFSFVWGVFCELHSARVSTGFGALAINFSEIKAWADLYDVTLEAWEIEAIRLVDATYFSFVNERRKEDEDKAKKRQEAPRGGVRPRRPTR